MTDDAADHRPLDAAAIEQFVTEVAEALLVVGDRHVVVVVGGALLAWRGLRAATRDVDSIRRIDDEMRVAVEHVAGRHGLAPRWLNDNAAAFVPATFVEEDCDVLLDHPALLVLGAPLEQVFVMKLFAGRAADIADLETLWPQCGFESPDAATDAFHAAYPHLEHDPHLADWIRDLVREA